MSETDILKGKHIIPEGKSLRLFKQCSFLPFSLLQKEDKITRKNTKQEGTEMVGDSLSMEIKLCNRKLSLDRNVFLTNLFLQQNSETLTYY